MLFRSKEKQAIIVKTVEYVNGRVLVIAGTGANETNLTRDLTLIAKEHGADAALIVAPYYNKPSQDGLYEHYHVVAEQVDIPQIIYNIPGRTAVNILPSTIIKLAENHPNIVAVKEASGDLDQMMQIIKNSPDHFKLLSGDDALTIPVISIGGKGVVSVLSNYVPKKFGDCVRLALKGKFADALKIHYELFDLMDLNFIESNPVPVKYILSQMGLTNDTIRMPLHTLKNENKKRIKQELVKAGLIK